MQRMTMPNFCINFLNKAAKLLSISYDFAVAPSSDAWIKTVNHGQFELQLDVAPSSDAWIKTRSNAWQTSAKQSRTLLGCVD